MVSCGSKISITSTWCNWMRRAAAHTLLEPFQFFCNDGSQITCVLVRGGCFQFQFNTFQWISWQLMSVGPDCVMVRLFKNRRAHPYELYVFRLGCIRNPDGTPTGRSRSLSPVVLDWRECCRSSLSSLWTGTAWRPRWKAYSLCLRQCLLTAVMQRATKRYQRRTWQGCVWSNIQ